MVYPGAGIANSTGSAWGTSYTTSGSGTALALTTSPTFVTQITTPAVVLPSGSFSTTLAGNGSATANATYTWPTAAPGTAGYVLASTTGGALSWVANGTSTLTVGTTAISGGTSGYVLTDNAGVLGNVGTTGTGSVVFGTSPSIYGPTITGTASGVDLSVGPIGHPNILTVTAASSSPTGINITGNAAGTGTYIGVTSSGTNEDIMLDSKGTGNIWIGDGTSTPGAVYLGAGVGTTQLVMQGLVVLEQGTTSLPPIVFNNASTTTTTAVAGAFEDDGTAFYLTAKASTRQVVATEQWQVLSSSYTLTSTTSVQKAFNNTTNGALTLAVGTYEFECQFSLSSMSTTSGYFGFVMGGTAVTTQLWSAVSAPGATGSVLTPSYIMQSAASQTQLYTASTISAGQSSIHGVLRVTTAGTFIPEIQLSVASAAVMSANSFCHYAPKGSATVTTIGNGS